MLVKEIANMGEIVFDEFYNPNNIKINDLNSSPIKESKLIKVIDNNDIDKYINNHYISSILDKRSKYNIYSCQPDKLLSLYRYDIYIKYFYIKSYIENNNYELFKDIYLSSIKCLNNFLEPDKSKQCKHDFIENFHILIDSIKNKEFTTIIPISKTGIPIDGAHRVAICLYFKINIPFVVFDLLDGKYDRDFFENRGMNESYLKIIDQLILEEGFKL